MTAAPPELVQAVLADARQRAPDQAVQLLDAQAVTWRDGSLGCPKPDFSYTQALVPGWLLRVQAGERMLQYHASQRGGWLYCPAHRAQTPAPDSRPT